MIKKLFETYYIFHDLLDFVWIMSVFAEHIFYFSMPQNISASIYIVMPVELVFISLLDLNLGVNLKAIFTLMILNIGCSRETYSFFAGFYLVEPQSHL